MAEKMSEKTLEKTDEELSLLTLADKCVTHEQWLRVVSDGMPTLLGNPGLLLEIIMREALQEDGREHMNARTREIFPEAQHILKELRLKFSLEDQGALGEGVKRRGVGSIVKMQSEVRPREKWRSMYDGHRTGKTHHPA